MGTLVGAASFTWGGGVGFGGSTGRTWVGTGAAVGGAGKTVIGRDTTTGWVGPPEAGGTSVLASKGATVSDGSTVLTERTGVVAEVDARAVGVRIVKGEGPTTPAICCEIFVFFLPGTKTAPPTPTPRTSSAATAMKMCVERKRMFTDA